MAYDPARTAQARISAKAEHTQILSNDASYALDLPYAYDVVKII